MGTTARKAARARAGRPARRRFTKLTICRLARMDRLRVRFFNWIGCQRVCACEPSRLPAPFVHSGYFTVIRGALIGCPSVRGKSVVRHNRSRPPDVFRHRRAAVAGGVAGRSGNRPSARVCVRGIPRPGARRAGDSALQRSGVQRPAARRQRSARARRSGPGRIFRAASRRAPGPRPGGGFPPRPSFGGPRFESGGAAPSSDRSRNFGPDAKPQRGAGAKKGKKGDERPRGPIPVKATRRSFTLDDDDAAATDEAMADIDNFATSKPADKEDDEDKEDNDARTTTKAV